MKKIIFSLTIVIFLLVSLSSCIKEESTSDLTGMNSLKASFQDENWKISLYIDCNEDETYHFSGYTFSFDTTGIVAVYDTSAVATGTWLTRTSDGHNKFDLNFGKTYPFHKINEDWHIIEKTDTIIRLEDISKKSGEAEFLTFIRI
jgi:hypothetical protein